MVENFKHHNSIQHFSCTSKISSLTLQPKCSDEPYLISSSFANTVQFTNSPPHIMVSNSMLMASSLHSPCTLFSSHKLCSSSIKTISKQSHTFLHRNPSLHRPLSLGSKRVLPSVCFFNTGDKSDSKAISQPFLYYLVLFPTQLLSQNI